MFIFDFRKPDEAIEQSKTITTTITLYEFGEALANAANKVSKGLHDPALLIVTPLIGAEMIVKLFEEKGAMKNV